MTSTVQTGALKEFPQVIAVGSEDVSLLTLNTAAQAQATGVCAQPPGWGLWSPSHVLKASLDQTTFSFHAGS